jgi:hypothetical protein
MTLHVHMFKRYTKNISSIIMDDLKELFSRPQGHYTICFILDTNIFGNSENLLMN